MQKSLSLLHLLQSLWVKHDRTRQRLPNSAAAVLLNAWPDFCRIAFEQKKVAIIKILNAIVL